MTKPGENRYNAVAGKNLDRLSALADGVFAVAMTLLVLDLHIPEAAGIHSAGALAAALLAVTPHLIPYLMSFVTLGIFWVGQQAQFNLLRRSDRDLTWIHIAFLVVVTLTPFSTALLSAFLTYRLALLIYWANIVLLGLTLYASWKYSQSAGLVKDDVPADIHRAVERRIIAGQTLYAIGAALCLINNWWSIGFIVAVQLNYAFAPRIWPLNRL